jgi:rhodanese-related sulfurtransferase
MKKLLFTIFVAAAALAASQAKELGRAEFEQLLVNPDHLLLIDVRRPDEVKDIGGFPAYFSVQIADLEKNLAWIPKDRTIVTISNHAMRSGQAADILAKHGFHVAGTIGAQTYAQQGGRLLKIAPPVKTTANRDAPVAEKQ